MLLLLALLPLAGAQAAPAAAPASSAFGINSHISSRYPGVSGMGKAADAVAQLQVGWAREDFQFSRIAPRKGAYDWSFFDAGVNHLSQRGVQIVGLLNGPTPAWASASGRGGFAPPTPAAYAEFVGAVVARYKDRVHHWQIWNEPDNAAYWSPAPDPAAYAALLKAGYAAVKQADPSALVLSAGIVSPEPATSFLKAIADNGAWGAFDILAIHPYVDPRSPEDGQIAAAGVGQVKVLADKLGAKPIWATEFGWSTGAGDRKGNRVDEQTQASYLVRAMALLREAGVEKLFWYTLKDLSASEGLGLLRYAGSTTSYADPKPAFSALRTMASQLGSAAPQGMLDFGQRRVVWDAERFGTWKRGNQPNGTFAASAAQAHSGGASGELRYSFPSAGNDYVVFTAADPIDIGSPSQVGFWVYGDGSGHALKVWLRDAQGEVLQYRLGFVGVGWQFLSASVGGAVERYNRISGGGNLRLDLPATLTAIVLDDEPDKSSGSGAIYLDDLTAVSGADAYGARFGVGGGVVDVLWAPGEAQISLPTSSASGTITAPDGTQRSISASGGQFTLSLGPSPILLAHQGGGSPAQPAAPQPTAAPQADPQQRCFDETGFCIGGRIREFWEQNGGLPVFGLPIGPQQAEVVEGATLQVQRFERNRLELHPENARPYDVLLGRLGADRLAQLGRDWQSEFPSTSAASGCRFFRETGQNVCGEILAAWRASGLELDGQAGPSEAESLALFGLPLGPAHEESMADGQRRTVQWFERARFELHPENQPPYRVQLGLLGSEIVR
ncbi:hypothetical protein F8S13_08055 [Chloroflexia bacterium SDU3-3]|nr:hypothetical protein F8S13_08055 [Chloroflexia bacterium SDU3-3]